MTPYRDSSAADFSALPFYWVSKALQTSPPQACFELLPSNEKKLKAYCELYGAFFTTMLSTYNSHNLLVPCICFCELL